MVVTVVGLTCGVAAEAGTAQAGGSAPGWRAEAALPVPARASVVAGIATARHASATAAGQRGARR
jgi:hypothetical protein